MKCMNVMQCNSQRQKRKTQKPKNKEQWSQRKSNEAQGPCQKDSVSLSLLHPNFLDTPRALEFYSHQSDFQL